MKSAAAPRRAKAAANAAAGPPRSLSEASIDHRAEQGPVQAVRDLADHKFALDQHAIVATTDVQGTITHVNEKFCEISQYSRDELIGKNHRILNSGHHSKEFFHDMYHAIANGKVWRREICNRAKDGSTYWVDTTIVPFLGGDGKPRQYIAIRADVTERMRAQEALKESLAGKEAALKGLADQKFALDQHSIVATTDVQGTITYVNDKFCEISKYPREELLGQNHRIINSGHHPTEFFQRMYQAIAHGKVWHGEICNRAKDGSLYWVDTTIVPLLNPDGKPRQYLAIRTDISERKRAEEARSYLAAVVQSSEDAIVAKTLSGMITAWNPGAEKLYGYSAAEAVGQPMRMLVPEDRSGEETEILDRIRRGESISHFDTVRLRKDGTRVDVSVGISPVKDTRGSTIGASNIARDISQRKQAEAQLAAQAEELSRQAAELARSNADLEQFAYVASHDLQEPLRMVTAYTQLLSERYSGKLDESADKFIGYAQDGAIRMQVLIQDLLAFSRVGRKEDAITTVDCKAVMDEVTQLLAPAIAEGGAVITFGELPKVEAVHTQMVQLFQNLIGNAIKFRGEQEPRIAVEAERQNGQWLFTVRDNGIGIAPEYAESIFVIFQRLHARAEYPGNGIGLAICKKIVERYGGKIWVESQHGAGSAFHFALPFRVSQRAEGAHA